MRPLAPPPERLPAAVKTTLAMLVCALAAGVVSLAVQKRQGDQAEERAAMAMTGGVPRAGLSAMDRHGCGACHEIPGLPQARGRVGPSLDKLATRAVIAGRLPNQPAALAAFVAQPQHIQPRGGMPDMPLTPTEARDITAYLYTLR